MVASCWLSCCPTSGEAVAEAVAEAWSEAVGVLEAGAEAAAKALGLATPPETAGAGPVAGETEVVRSDDEEDEGVPVS